LVLLLASSLDTTAAAENLTITPMFDDPVIVLEGQPLRAAFQTNLAINSGVGVQTFFQSNPQGLTAPPSLNLEVGKSDWLAFPAAGEHTRPENWRMKWYRGNVTQPENAYGIELKHAAVEDHGTWTVSITTDTDPVQQGNVQFEVIVAKAPKEVVFEGDKYQGGDVVFETGFGQNDISSEDIRCKAVECSPPPTFMWMIDEVLVYYRNDTQGENQTVDVEDGARTRTYYTSTETLTFHPQSWMDGRRFYCVVNQTAYNTSHSLEDRSASFLMRVLAPPVPSTDVIETLAEEELKSGKEGLLMVPFHANPEPMNLTWYLDGLTNPLGMNETRDRFSSRGWIRYNHSLKVDNEPNQYVALLDINKLKVKDSDTVHNISIANAKGTTMYQFRIQQIKKGGLSAGEIAGIVVGVVAGVILIALCVILIIRRKNIRKAKIQRQERRRQREDQ